MRKLLICLPLFLLLNACISAPPGLEKSEFRVQNLRKLSPDDYACQCKEVRFGGKIIAATALQNKTKIEVLSLPIASFSAKPVLTSTSDGRFMAYLEGFVDPETLKDQYITVVGRLMGMEKGKIDEANYDYPLIQVQHYKRWKLVEEYYYDPDDWYDYWESRRFGGFFFFRPEPRLRYNLY
ncbi:Slp family lipoprotein [Conservatibacter flavescens]|uniref:Starvation-inducible protein n=1 Tax=Conservatibacter flavescens TaxID=28161 RepID=A0A2M8S223_9PAST|nr:Slp family lipoprotein [Conservatibacter flavescens]PJG85193.1 hypothetical protein CVP05_08020 [Conservatibacter flavescens]